MCKEALLYTRNINKNVERSLAIYKKYNKNVEKSFAIYKKYKQECGKKPCYLQEI